MDLDTECPRGTMYRREYHFGSSHAIPPGLSQRKGYVMHPEDWRAVIDKDPSVESKFEVFDLDEWRSKWLQSLTKQTPTPP